MESLQHSRNSMPWLILLLLGAILTLLIANTVQTCTNRDREEKRQAAVDAHLKRARDAAAAGEFELAQEALMRARELAPNDPSIQTEIMRVRVLEAARKPNDIKKHDLAFLEYATRVLESLPDAATDSTHLIAAGHVALAQGQPTIALEKYEQARQRNGKDVNVYLALARYYRLTKNPLKALESFKEAVKVEPDNLTALNNLGVQHVELGNNEEGIELFRRALKVQDNAASRVNLAQVLASQNKLTEAVEHLKRAAQLSPRSAEVFRQLGDLYIKAGNAVEAERAYLISLDIEPDLATSVTLGRLYRTTKQLQKAADLFARLTSAHPDAPLPFYELATTFKEAGNTKEAAGYFRQYIRLAKGMDSEGERLAAARAYLTAQEQAGNATGSAPKIEHMNMKKPRKPPFVYQP